MVLKKLNDFWFQNHFWWDFFRCCFWSCKFYSIEMIIWQLKNLERSSIGYKSYFRTKNCICLQNVMPVLCNSLGLLVSLPCTVVQSPPYTNISTNDSTALCFWLQSCAVIGWRKNKRSELLSMIIWRCDGKKLEVLGLNLIFSE